ncbi:30S ribosomal protein S2 [Candidatus Cerribacteria bacterium 'Amazon FNV 2010 28 9']|uniref:Small ribosomal subunit protein uS2 n=1 Tax=Candidatus Cerribacteria bacterium 'Amazon FNV 2010 28 9' TaxID=2081795 RepID=A0A317JQG1_9BACT|nr:MAG: 30S ribosomal protein S2 [Candidatus Cerribacteria bacterium 'Amazon FNV 2010 28 9']
MSDATFSVDLEALLEAGCHFGHQARRWNPKMAQYIYGERDGVHIFDLAKTAQGLEAASQKIAEAAKQGRSVVFIGTKRQSQDIVREEVVNAGAMYITNRWPGGLITNWEQVGKSIKRLNSLKKDKAEGKFNVYTKKENVLIDREIARLERFFGGVSTLTGIPDILVITDVNKDIVAVKEAHMRGVFIIAICDSNVNPDLVDLVIPANDDAIGSLKIIIATLAKAFKEGKAMNQSAKEKQPVETK